MDIFHPGTTVLAPNEAVYFYIEMDKDKLRVGRYSDEPGYNFHDEFYSRADLSVCTDLREVIKASLGYQEFVAFEKRKALGLSLDGRKHSFRRGEIVVYQGSTFMVIEGGRFDNSEIRRCFIQRIVKAPTDYLNRLLVSHYDLAACVDPEQLKAGKARFQKYRKRSRAFYAGEARRLKEERKKR